MVHRASRHATRNSIIDSVVACVHSLARTFNCWPTNAAQTIRLPTHSVIFSAAFKDTASKPAQCAAVPTQQKRNASRSAAVKWLRSFQLVRNSDTRLKRQSSLSCLPLHFNRRQAVHQFEQWPK